MDLEETCIVEALKSGEFILTLHAARHMNQRAVTEADLRACGRTATSCIYQAKQGTWRIEGEDLDGEILTVVCGMDEIVVIVTIF